jgi:hypothetical protein
VISSTSLSSAEIDISALIARLRLLEEENRWLKAQLFGRSSEKTPREDLHPAQAWLFNEAEALAAERFHKTILNEFYQVAFRKKIYATIEELQVDLDAWIDSYNHERTHQGKMCCGRTPMATFEDGKQICREKSIA